jgi:hypothetical protein
MALHKATGMPVLQARDFIRSSPPELIQRILNGHNARYANLLTNLPPDLANRVQNASDSQPENQPLHDPFEDDPLIGPVIRRVLDEALRDMIAQHGDKMGLCHLTWRTAQERLLRVHSIVWYSPAQMNPGSCFD